MSDKSQIIFAISILVLSIVLIFILTVMDSPSIEKSEMKHSYKEVCIDGVVYLENPNKITVKYDKSGVVMLCKNGYNSCKLDNAKIRQF